MKKWLYFVVPLIGLIVFVFFYISFADQAEKAEIARKAEIVRKTEEEQQRKAVLEERARQDAAKKAQERADADALKEREKTAKWEKQGKDIQDDIDDAIKTSSELTAKIVQQEKELANLRKAKENANRDLVEAARAVEQAKVDRRGAEMNIQRLTAFLAKRAEDSALAAPPALPVAPAK
jgi:flagellar motor protein MotB